MNARVESFFVCIVILLTCATVMAQNKERIVQDKSFENQPVKVISKFIGHEKFKNQERIYAEKDWLRSFSFEVQNTSKKNIFSIHFYVEVQKQGSMNLPLAIPVVYMARKQGEVIGPGETVSIKFPSDTYFNVKKLLDRDKASDVEKVILSVRQVYFTNYTRWVEGFESTFDPNDPVKMTIINSSFHNVFYSSKLPAT